MTDISPQQAVQILDELVNKFGLTEEEYGALHHSHGRKWEASPWASIKHGRDYWTKHKSIRDNTEGRIVALRLRALLEKLKAAKAQALTEVMNEYPLSGKS
jgi:hypothetical protein